LSNRGARSPVALAAPALVGLCLTTDGPVLVSSWPLLAEVSYAPQQEWLRPVTRMAQERTPSVYVA